VASADCSHSNHEKCASSSASTVRP
jgi:hypothetical protein